MQNRFRLLAALSLLGALAALPACNDDFLTEVPSDFVAPQNFYRNQGDALAAVNAAYASFINLPSPYSSSDYVGRNFWMVAEYPTEVVTSRLSAANERSQVDNYHSQFSSSHPYLLGIWQSAYAGINRANTVLARVPTVPMDATRRDQILAEAKFLRALHYYWLAGLFGGVPLRLEETLVLDGGDLPRATARETWDQIIKDLTEAAAVLPTSWPAGDFGRATKGAALTLLGKARLQAGQTLASTPDIQAASEAFATVRGLGYTLEPGTKYGSLFDGSNEQSPEIIFSLQNVRVDGYGGRITEWFSPVTSPQIFQAGAQNQFQAERVFYDSYNTKDVRKAATWLTTFQNRGKTITWAWADSFMVKDTVYGSTGPVPRKYLDLAAPDGGAEAPDVVLFRYADVLLSSAEAINELSGPSAAYTLVNEVRARAGLPNLTPGLSKDAFRDSLFLERRYELALEMHGIFDNRRNWTWSKKRLEETMTSISTKNRTPNTSSTTKFNAAPLNEKWKLYPIPVRACELNPLLTQNPGWVDGICKTPAPATP
ncbi:MAG TPA: RagB/SusD family nutrient uptake outer membrane protein [Gemmatimonadaceae bacterium]|nr:RagB/SusD family nutrient uptake outer membrane protein [Gemmatimonadaceae bacterium]